MTTSFTTATMPIAIHMSLSSVFQHGSESADLSSRLANEGSEPRAH
jgi:hypothetical protein